MKSILLKHLIVTQLILVASAQAQVTDDCMIRIRAEKTRIQEGVLSAATPIVNQLNGLVREFRQATMPAPEGNATPEFQSAFAALTQGALDANGRTYFMAMRDFSRLYLQNIQTINPSLINSIQCDEGYRPQILAGTTRIRCTLNGRAEPGNDHVLQGIQVEFGYYPPGRTTGQYRYQPTIRYRWSISAQPLDVTTSAGVIPIRAIGVENNLLMNTNRTTVEAADYYFIEVPGCPPLAYSDVR